MLTPQQMTKVTIASPNAHVDAIIEALHDLKVLHIDDHRDESLAPLGNVHDRASRLSEVLVRVRSMISNLGIDSTKRHNITVREVEKISGQVDEVIASFNAESGKVKEVASRIDGITNRIGELRVFEHLDVPLESFREYDLFSFFIGHVADSHQLMQEVSETLSSVEMQVYPSHDAPLVILVSRKNDSSKVQAVLTKHKFSAVSLAPFEGLEGLAKNHIDSLRREVTRLTSEREKAEHKIAQIAKKQESFLCGSEKYLKTELEKAEAPLRFAQTQSTTVITGYFPSSMKKKVDRALQTYGSKMLVEYTDPTHHDSAPIKFKNPEVVKSFEFFLDLYTRPSYSELDPTFFVFLSFPIFFGFILGDFGYGVVAFILFFILKRKIPAIEGFMNILMVSSLMSAVFGIVYGEVFGYEVLFGKPIPHLISRAHDVIGVLVLALIAGIIHVNIGYLLGFVNELKSHGFFKALCAKGGWIVFQGAIFLYAAPTLGFEHFPGYAAHIVLVVSLIMLYIGEGVQGILELPAIFSSVMSYSRLMAIGLTSVLLAVVVNSLVEAIAQGGIVGIVFGVIVFIIGHIVNIIIGIFGSFLHPLRLHYVEFFTKFFHGGGKKYSPFGVRE